MKIETNHIKSNVIYTAILIHSVIIAMAPALSLMGILYIDSKTQRRSNVENSVMFDNSGLVSGVIGFSVILIIIITVVVYLRNSKKKYVVGVEFDDSLKRLNVKYKTYYNNRIKTTEIKYETLNYAYDDQQSASQLTGSGVDVSDLLLDRKIKIMDGEKYAGEISMSGTFWNKEGGKIKMIMNKINSVKVVPKSQ